MGKCSLQLSVSVSLIKGILNWCWGRIRFDLATCLHSYSAINCNRFQQIAWSCFRAAFCCTFTGICRDTADFIIGAAWLQSRRMYCVLDPEGLGCLLILSVDGDTELGQWRVSPIRRDSSKQLLFSSHNILSGPFTFEFRNAWDLSESCCSDWFHWKKNVKDTQHHALKKSPANICLGLNKLQDDCEQSRFFMGRRVFRRSLSRPGFVFTIRVYHFLAGKQYFRVFLF